MPSSPPVEVFLTTIASQPALRQRQEYILRILQVKKITFTSYDLASNEDAKRFWKRKAPANKQQLPGILVGGVFPGTFEDFEEAVEYDELASFLRLNETWNNEDEDVPLLEAKPVGVPGASSPSQMSSHRPSFASAPSPLKDKSKADGELDAGSLLEDTSLQGVSVTDDDLADLVKELGLEGDEAGELVKGLSSTKEAGLESQESPSEKKSEAAPPSQPAAAEASSENRQTHSDDPQIVAVDLQSDRELVKKPDDTTVESPIA